jgi:hypothetical protein
MLPVTIGVPRTSQVPNKSTEKSGKRLPVVTNEENPGDVNKCRKSDMEIYDSQTQKN